MAKLALSKGCNRLEWLVVRGNEDAAIFYEKMGKCRLPDLELFRMPKEELERLTVGF